VNLPIGAKWWWWWIFGFESDRGAKTIFLFDRASVERLKEQLGPLADKVDMFGTHGVQWLTVSDGKHSIRASIAPDCAECIEKGGRLQKYSTFELLGYVITDNIDEQYRGRMLILTIGIFKLKRRNVPRLIGRDVKDIFDSKAKPGPGLDDAVELENGVLFAGLAPKREGAIEELENAPTGSVLQSPGLAFEVDFIAKGANPEGEEVWHVGLTDGKKSLRACLIRSKQLSEMGLSGQMENNAREIMVEGERGVDIRDTICVKQFVKLSDHRSNKQSPAFWLTTVSILEKANPRN